ncbi:MAG TPA: acetyl-CoA carboxylase biotin carboxyl carrier protein [Nitrospiraceae bacterium]
MSKKRSRKQRANKAPIILPQDFADTPVGQGKSFLLGNQSRHVQELIDILKRNNLTELELEREGVRIRVRHEQGIKTITSTVADASSGTVASASQPSPTGSTSAEDVTGLVTIASPIVGTFYRSPSPDADPYVEEGDYVKKGQVLCIVEAMKLMNEIESEVDGRVTKILAESTKPVEYGQALFLVDPKATP